MTQKTKENVVTFGKFRSAENPRILSSAELHQLAIDSQVSIEI